MGQLHTFACEFCSYHDEVSSGEDVGMIGVTTIYCDVCRELYDVVVWRVGGSANSLVLSPPGYPEGN